MYRFVIIIVFIFFFGCKGRDKIRKREVLNDKEFISVLIDIHIADGLIQFKNLQAKNKKSDSVSLYNYVLKKHHISREKFRKTIDYYTVHNESYIKIYDSVQSYLKKQEKKLYVSARGGNKEKLKDVKEKLKDTTELWNLKKEWSFPKDGIKNPIPFKINIHKPGTYILKARIKIFPDDQTVNQRMTIIANYFDGTKDINSNGTMVKDGEFGDYDVSVSVNPEKRLKYISGWLLDHSKGTRKKHAQIKNISLKRIRNKKILIK